MNIYNQGAIEAFIHSFKWMLLFMAYYPDVQQKLKNEIQCEIGENIFDNREQK